MKRATLAILTADVARAWVRALDRASGDEILIDLYTDESELGLKAREAARKDTSGEIELDGRIWFLEVHNPPLELVLVGAVHIAQPLAAMGALAGYAVRVIDPRGAFASEARFPGVALCRDWPDEALVKAPLGSRSALVVLAHDPKIDDPALEAALRSPAFYLGALGSKKNHAARLERLAARGFSQEALARIQGPVGLAIGARSPAEIALSILAQMTQTLRA
jgi:xanthine dehydrogenase accessory factor